MYELAQYPLWETTLGRIVTAHVEMSDGRDFIAEIANLTPHSVFIRTPEVIPFRSKVTVTFFSVSVAGELALRTRDPLGWTVVFTVSDELRARIEARIPEVNVLVESTPIPIAPSIALDEATITGPSELRAALEALEELQDLDSVNLRNALQSSGGIPSAVTAPKLETAAASALDPDLDTFQPELELELDIPIEEVPEVEGRTVPAMEKPDLSDRLTKPAVQKISKSRRAIPTAAKTTRLRPTPVRTPRRRDLTRREDPTQPAPVGDATAIDLPSMNRVALTDIPVLAEDQSTVVFSSTAQYLLQHRTNIAHGAIVVRARPVAIGTEKTLRIQVPGGNEPYTLHAHVILTTEDSIGLSIDSFDDHAEALKMLVLAGS